MDTGRYWREYEDTLRREWKRGLGWAGRELRERYMRDAPREYVSFVLGGPLPEVERLKYIRARSDYTVSQLVEAFPSIAFECQSFFSAS